MNKYHDRNHAGKILAEQLRAYAHQPQVIVLALPRGGVPIGYEIASTLDLPLDIFIVRKLGVPWHEELAMGALASGGVIVFNEDILRDLAIPPSEINRIIQTEKSELERRETKYRGNRPFTDIRHQTVILVDDGIATGASIRAAIKAIKQLSPTKIILAVPVAAQTTCRELTKKVDQLICPLQPVDFEAVAKWYDDFPQTSDEEVIRLLQLAQE